MKDFLIFLFPFFIGLAIWQNQTVPVDIAQENKTVPASPPVFPGTSPDGLHKNNGFLLPIASLFLFDSASFNSIITFNQIPSVTLNVDFQFSPDGACSGTPVAFTSTVTGGTAPFVYSWRFGDGIRSSAQDTSRIFNLLGCGTATLSDTLIVTDATGLSDTAIHPISILRMPDVQLKDQNVFASPQFSNCQNFPTVANPDYNLTVTNNSPNANCISLYSIDWGDGTVQSGLTGSNFPLPHHYTQLGEYTLTVTATGINGCSNSKSYTVLNHSDPGVGISGPLGTSGCAPIGFWFKLKDYQVNSPGTKYIWNFGDGTPTVTWTPPLSVDSIFHVFDETSCGKPNNEFVVSVTAVNSCFSKSAFVNGVKIYKKPAANFTAPLSACTNQAVNFVNTSIGSYNQGSCSRLTTYLWNFGDPSSSTNTSSSISASHTFSMAGNYTVTLVATGGCGNDTLTKQICITAPPVPSFTLDTTNICTAGTIAATNASVTGTCLPVKYQWSVTYTTGFCGNSASWAFTNNTNDSSANPSFIFNSAGTYTITLRILGTCTVPGFSKVVTVKRKPLVSLPAIVSSCNPLTICPVPSISDCGDPSLTYHWLFDGGALGASDSLNPGCITFSSVGTHSIFLAVSNRCGTDTVIRTFQINAGPQLLNFPSSDTSFFCPGQTVGPYNFASNPLSPPTIINWTNSNSAIGLGNSGVGNISAFPAANTTNSPITARVIVRATNNGCSTQDTIFITVNPKPLPPAVTTQVNYCKDAAAAPLSNAVTITGGNTLLWYTSATGGTGSTTAPVPTTNALGTTNYYVSQVNAATGCESNRSQITVTVRPVPVITGSSSTNPDSCGAPRGSITLTGLLPTTFYFVSYNVNGVLAPSVSLSSNGSGNLTINGLVAGSYSAVTVTLNGCTSSAAGPFLLTDPGRPATPAPSANGPLCEGSLLILSVNTIYPAGATYLWTGPHGFLSSLPNPTINNATVAEGGTYVVTVKVSGCTSLPGSANVVINPNPATPAPSGNSICSGDTLRLFSNTGAVSTISFQWTGPGGFTSTLQNPLIPDVAPSASGAYSLVITNTLTGCRSAAGTTNVVVRPTPTISSTGFSNPTGCALSNGTITLGGLSPTTTYTVQYSKSNGPGTTVLLASDATGNIVLPGLDAGTYINISVSLNGCLSNTVGPVTLLYNPPFTATASSNSPLCDGNTLRLSGNPSSSASVSYLWQGPGGFSNTLQNPVITNATVINSGPYYLTVTINGCVKIDSTIVTVSSRSVGGDTYNDTTVCAGANAGRIDLRGQYGSILRWESSADNGITWNALANSTASHSYANLISSTLYRVAIKNGVCPVAYSDTTKISVVPTVTAVNFTPLFYTMCSHDTIITFNGSAIYSGSDPVRYSWFVNNTLVTGNANPFLYRFRTPLNAAQPTEYHIALSVQNSLGCGDTLATGKIIVWPLPAASIRVSPSLVQQEPHSAFAFEDISPADPNKTDTWYLGDRSAHTGSGKKINFDYGEPGTYNVLLQVKDHATGCIANDSVKVTVLAVPGTLFIPNAFYPNSSIGKIKTFKPEGVGLETYHLQVFDTWGRLIFETKELTPDGIPKTGWDGTDSRTGKPLPQDAYAWKIVEAKFKNGRSWGGMSYNGGKPKPMGTVTLFR